MGVSRGREDSAALANTVNGYAPLNSSLKIPVSYIQVAPGYEYDYVQITSPVNVTATSEATATTIITGNPVTYDGSTIVMLEFFFPYASAPLSAARDWEIIFYDSVAGTSIGGILHGTISSASNQRTTANGKYRITPSAGTHTYSVRGFLGAAGTVVAGAGAGGNGNVFPGFLRITKV